MDSIAEVSRPVAVTRARMSNAEVVSLAKRVNELFLSAQPRTQKDTEEMEAGKEKLLDALAGRVSIVEGGMTEDTIETIKALPVVVEMGGTERARSLIAYREFFANSLFFHNKLSRTGDPEHPNPGDYLVGTGSGAVIQECSDTDTRTAAVDDKDSLSMKVTPKKDGSVVVVITVPEGKRYHFGGVTSGTYKFNSFAEAQTKIEAVLKKAKAIPAAKALRDAEEIMKYSPIIIGSYWSGNFQGKIPVLGSVAALNCVAHSPPPGGMLYMPWKTKEQPPKYYLAVHKEGEDPQNYEVFIKRRPGYLMAKKPCPLFLKIGGVEHPLSLDSLDGSMSLEDQKKEFQRKQEDALQRAFGVTAVRYSETLPPTILGF